MIEDGRAVGVEFDIEGSRIFAKSRGEVIVATGSIGSPAILERSGIGDGERLNAAGIQTVGHLPGVGENLQDHLQIRCAYKITGAATLNTRAGTRLGKTLIGLEYLLARSGPMSMAPSQLGIFAKSNPRFATANLQYPLQPLSLAAWGGKLDPFPAFTASVANLRPESRGAVHIRSADPAQAYHSAGATLVRKENDRIVAIEAIRLTRRIVAQHAMARFNPTEFRPGPVFQSDAEILQSIGDISSPIFHPVGTAAMGHGPNAVVDDQPAGARHRRPARRRCLGHADGDLGQHQRANDDDRRESRHYGAGGCQTRCSAYRRPTLPRHRLTIGLVFQVRRAPFVGSSADLCPEWRMPASVAEKCVRFEASSAGRVRAHSGRNAP